MFGKNKDNKSSSRKRPFQTKRAQTYYYKNNLSEQKPAGDMRSQRRRFAWIHNLPAYVAALIIVGSLLYSLVLYPSPKIVIVNNQETAVQPFLRSKDAYEDIVRNQLDNSLLNRTKLTLNTDKAAGEIATELPEATDVSITLPIIGRHPVVYLRIAEPSFVLANESGSYVIDEQGRAVVATQELPDPDFVKKLVVVNDESGVAIEVGKQAIPKDQVKFINSIKTLLADRGVKVKKMVLPSVVNELHVYPSKTSYFVKYNFLLDAREQTGKYIALAKQLKKDNVVPSSYVDVRVEERAYVR